MDDLSAVWKGSKSHPEQAHVLRLRCSLTQQLALTMYHVPGTDLGAGAKGGVPAFLDLTG